MVSEAGSYLDRAPQLLMWPGLAIRLMVLAFNLAGDATPSTPAPRPNRRASHRRLRPS